MSNPSRAKGTAGENFFLPRLKALFGTQVERAPLKGTHDYGDFVGVPWLHEAKHSMKPLFQKWARVNERKAGKGWVLMWKGDLRTKSGNGPYVVMPLAMYELLVFYAADDETSSRPRLEMLQDDIRFGLGGK